MGCQCNSNNNKYKNKQNNSNKNKTNIPKLNSNININSDLNEKPNDNIANKNIFEKEDYNITNKNVFEKEEKPLKKSLKQIKIPPSILSIIEKNFTFINENNKNVPNLYLNDNSVTLCPGYNFKYRNEEEIKIDLTQAGFNKEIIDILIKASKLTGIEAKKFCEENKNIEITEENKKKLFKQIYPFYQLNAKKIIESEGDVNYDKIPDSVKEFINDLRFRGDLSGKNIEKCREALKTIEREKDYTKLKQFSDELFEKTKNKIPERAENRKELLKEIISKNSFDSLNSSLNSTLNSEEINISIDDITVEQKKNALGGIDLNADYNFDDIIKNADKIKLQGVFEKNSQMYFFKQKNKENNHFCNLEDLAVVLRILYDPEIKYKNISFSLEPYEPTNYRGPYQRKVFYPDEHIGKKVLEGTKMGEDMFKADYLLKQLNLGVDPNCKEYVFPKELKELSKYSFINNEFPKNPEISRAWIVVRKIKMMKSKNIYCYDGIKLGVDARQMMVGNKGTLEDRIDQNPEHLCYKFAKKFSEVYNDVGNVYEIFNRLKEITYAIALGRWMFLNKFPIDFEKVKKIYENTLIPNYQTKVKAIDFKKEKITQNNVEIDFDDAVRENKININEIILKNLKLNNLEINEKNKQMALKLLKEKNKTFTMVKTIKDSRFLFGGVDLNSGIEKSETNFIQKNENNNIINIDDIIDNNNDNNNNNLEKIISREGDEIKIDLNNNDIDVGEFPLLNESKCDECGKGLTNYENQISELYKESLKQKKYCSNHNKFICPECNKLLLGKYLVFKEKYFHNECIKCFSCKKTIRQNEKYVPDEDKIFHAECKDEFLKRIELETIEDEKCRINEMEKYEIDLSNDRSLYFINVD